MYELCAQDDELWTISAVRASFADDRRIQYAIWNYCSENCAGSKFAATMWDFKSNWDNLEFRTAVQDPICNAQRHQGGENVIPSGGFDKKCVLQSPKHF